MPFPKQESRPFTKEDIELLNPNQDGVYGIFSSDEWIYIGKGDIRTRMLAHVGGDNTCINSRNPTHWVGEKTDNMDAREKELTIEYDPICNKQVG